VNELAAKEKEILQKMQLEIAALQERDEALRTEASAHREQTRELQAKLAEAETLVHDLHAQAKAAAAAAAADLSKAHKQAQEEGATKEAEIEMLREAQAQHHSEVQSLREAMSKAAEEGLSAEKATHADMSALQQALEAHRKEIETLQDRLQHQEQARSEAESKVVAVQARARHGWNVVREIAGTRPIGAEEEEGEEDDKYHETAAAASARHSENEVQLQALRAQADTLEADNAARIIENATLREEIAVARQESTHAAQAAAHAAQRHEQEHQTLLLESEATRSRHLELERALAAASAELVDVKAQLVDAQAQAESAEGQAAALQEQSAAASALQVGFRSEVNSLRARLAAADGELSIAQERVQLAEERSRALEDKKKRDLDFLKQQNQKISDIQMDRADIIDKAEAAEAKAKELKSLLDASVSREQVEVMVTNAKSEAERALHNEQQLSSAMRTRLQEMVATEGEAAKNCAEVQIDLSRAQAEAEMAQQQVLVLEQQVTRLSTLNKDKEAAESNEREEASEALQAALDAERNKAQKQAHFVASLEKERLRLENELAEAHAHAHAAMQARDKPRQRGSANPYHDLEGGNAAAAAAAAAAGGDAGDFTESSSFIMDHDEDERKGSAAVSAMVARVLNTMWAAMGKHAPWLLATFGEKPPRLGPQAQGVLVYMVVLHMLILLRVV
jgi:predicted  nucleic acid-binding Zn-ribbon protein